MDGRSFCGMLAIAAAAGVAAVGVGCRRAGDDRRNSTRDRIYEGESVMYQVTLNHVENPREPDLKPLAADFRVVLRWGSRRLNACRCQSDHQRAQDDDRSEGAAIQLSAHAQADRHADDSRPNGRDRRPATSRPGADAGGPLARRARHRADGDPRRPRFGLSDAAVHSNPFDRRQGAAETLRRQEPRARAVAAAGTANSLGGRRTTARRLAAEDSTGGNGSVRWRTKTASASTSTISAASRCSRSSIMRRSAFLPHYEKVRLADKSGKETTYWRLRVSPHVHCQDDRPATRSGRRTSRERSPLR